MLHRALVNIYHGSLMDTFFDGYTESTKWLLPEESCGQGWVRTKEGGGICIVYPILYVQLHNHMMLQLTPQIKHISYFKSTLVQYGKYDDLEAISSILYIQWKPWHWTAP